MAYLPLSTANLPDPAINPAQDVEPRDYFETFLYTGNGAGLQVGDVIKKPADTTDISSSLIFNDGDSAYLSKTLTTPTNQYKWTWSGWLKYFGVSGDKIVFSTYDNSDTNNRAFFGFDGGVNFEFRNYESGTRTRLRTNRQFKGGEWYHFVVVFDSTQAIDSNRTKIYVNGIQETSFVNTGDGYYVGQNEGKINRADQHQLGSHGTSAYFDGYMAEVHFIDGVAHDETDFGNFDANGIWIPKAVTGITYGNNGFYLDFSDNTSTTTLGEDQAGSNDWTLNGYADTSKQVSDSPTDNFMTLSSANADGSPVLSEGNLKVSLGDNDEALGAFKIRAKNAGKFYWEVDYISSAGNNYKVAIGIANEAGTAEVVNYGHQAPTYNTTNLIGVALDTDNQTIEWFKDGVSMGTATDYSNKNWTYVRPTITSANSAGEEVVEVNFGQKTFAETPPTGYLDLSEDNITVDDQNLESPDLVWIKNRDNADNHHIYDSVRGVQKAMYPDPASTLQEQDAPRGLLNFNTNGFTVGDDGAVNRANQDYVAWCWKAPTSFSNAADTNGASIASSGKVSTESGFSICTYTATGTAGTVKHGLTQAPDMLIFMRRDGDGTDHLVYHSALGATKNLRFNNTDAQNINTFFDDTEPTSSVFSVDSALATTDRTFVVYCFHSVEGHSKFGSFSGNNSTDGPFIYLGFRPALFMVKCTNTTGSWYCYDTTRLDYNVMGSQGQPIAWDTAAGEDSGADASWYVDALSNGIKIRNNSNFDNGTNSFIYMAFAENPFKYSLAR